jgi:hypothetical protein
MARLSFSVAASVSTSNSRSVSVAAPFPRNFLTTSVAETTVPSSSERSKVKKFRWSPTPQHMPTM